MGRFIMRVLLEEHKKTMCSCFNGNSLLGCRCCRLVKLQSALLCAETDLFGTVLAISEWSVA